MGVTHALAHLLISEQDGWMDVTFTIFGAKFRRLFGAWH